MKPTQNTDSAIPEARLVGYFRIAPDGLPALVRKPGPADNDYSVTETGLLELAKPGGQEPSHTEAVPASTCPVDLVAETDDETTGRVLRSAALYLERHGWIQGTYYDATSGSFTPPACMVGAIGMVCYGGPVDAPAQHFDDPGFLDFEAAVLHLDRYLLAEDGSESYEFNDAKGRAAWHVIQVLEDAAARPAHELIDALRLIEAKNADMAAMAELLVPSGAFAGSEGPDGPDGAPFEPLPPGKPWARCDNPRCVFCSRGSQSGGDVR
jgi:hypothetical protein